LALVGLLAGVATGGCRGRGTTIVPVSQEAERIEIGPPIAPAADVDSLIAPYRREMERQMGEALAICPAEIRTGRPEGLLGALVADIVLARAQAEFSRAPVDACLLNNGGLRARWYPGEITLGLVYETMPFDNEIVLLRLSGAQVRTLADEIAQRGGEPVAGLSFTIRSGRAADVHIAKAPLASRDYWIATNSYLASGGGGMPTLWEPRETHATGVLIRTAMADALRAWGAGVSRAATVGVLSPPPQAPATDRLGTIPMPQMGRIQEEP
jgi:2',3'-cyclic-nucleotide 2'-phosphodiesterase (5'-nucleotidase family)